jgi:rfaE bifunctional protein kinase chain/domain
LENISGRIRSSIGSGKSIAFVSGNFNVLHPGHLRLLKFANDLTQNVVVGLNPDTTRGVTVSGAMRLEGLKALTFVTEAVLLAESVEDFICQLRPDFVVKGKEFEGAYNPEAAAVLSYGGKLIFSSGEMRFSSTDLLRQEYTETTFSTIRKPHAFPTRHGFAFDDLRKLLNAVSGMRVTIVGDMIVDDYITCDPIGMSQEDPTIVVTPIQTTTFVGGSGVVAAHAHNLGAQTRLFTVLGQDATADEASTWLQAEGISLHAFSDETRPTTRKQRYRALSKTLLRVNHLRQHSISREIARKILNQMEEVLPDTDLLMFADFNYGCLPQSLVDEIVRLGKSHNVVMAADSQASSQVSDISRFRGMKLVTPTEREARLAMRDTDAGLALLAERLCDTAEAQNVIITLGGEGMLVHGQLEGGGHMTDRLPAMNSAPKDVAGAGDSLFTATSMALCSGADIWRSAYLGAIAAACQVSRVGNSPLKTRDILTEIEAPDV